VAAAAIRLDSLTKYFGPVVGLEGLSLAVEPGEVFGFLGANGAGKTTTIRILLDLLRPTGGRASILGFDCQRQTLEARRRIGYLPGEMPMYPELTGAAYLKLLSALGHAPPAPGRLEALFRRFDVSDVDLGRRMRDYSHGMKRKLGIIQALMTDAPVLILDEPTSGLDPLMIEAFGETIDAVARAGRTTVFLSSHVLSEVDRVCQRIGLVRSGRLVAVRSLGEMRASTRRRVTVVFAAPVAGALPAPEPALPPGVTVIVREPGRWTFDVQGPVGPLLQSLAPLAIDDVQLSAFSTGELLRLFAEEHPC
jgi:ABC-2 type transport system ATP-binding protein